MILASLVKELRYITSAPLMDCKKALEESNGNLEQAQQVLRKKGKILANKKSSREAKEGVIAIYSSVEHKKIGMLKLACETDFVARNEKFQIIAERLTKLLALEGAKNFEEKKLAGLKIKDYIIEKIANIRENIVISQIVQWKYADNSIINSYLHHNKKIGALVELEGDTNEQTLLVAKDLCLHIAANPVECIDENDLSPESLAKEKRFLINQASQSNKPAKILEKIVEGKLKKFKKEMCLLEQPFLKNTEISVREFLTTQSKSLNQNLRVKKFIKFNF